MIWQHVRVALLAGGIVAGTALSARAEDCCQPAPCAPQVQTVTCTEWVPETYQTTRTVYRQEYKQESYTAYRCECVPEVRTRTCTYYTQVPEVRNVVRNVCTCVPVVEERTVMQTHVSYKPVTTVSRRCVDHGHYECREVPCPPSFWERMRKHFHHHKDCCCEPEPCCVRMKTVRVWVPCPVWEEVPVTCMQRICESVPVTCKVTVMKREVHQETVQVTCYRCVPQTRTENYTAYTQRTIPYQASRCVAICVPTQEAVTCTRMVPRQVTKQVPVATSACCAPTNECCATTCGRSHHHRRCGGLSFRHHHDCCE
jgi:hypothetical protein